MPLQRNGVCFRKKTGHRQTSTYRVAVSLRTKFFAEPLATTGFNSVSWSAEGLLSVIGSRTFRSHLHWFLVSPEWGPAGPGGRQKPVGKGQGPGNLFPREGRLRKGCGLP